MRRAMGIAAVLVLGVFLFCLLYMWSRFVYTFDDAHLQIRWILPGGIPFGSRRIQYERITEVRRFSWRLDVAGFGELWGNLPARQPFVLILSSSTLRRGPFRKIWLTPPDPATFAERLALHGVRIAAG